jgi:hypothetical protein
VAFAADKTPNKVPAPIVPVVTEKKDTAEPPRGSAAPPSTAASEIKPANDKNASGLMNPAAPSGSAPKASANPPAKTGDKAETKPAAVEKTAGKQPEPKPAAAAKKEPGKPIKTAKERLHDYIRANLAAKRFQENLTKVKSELEKYPSELANAEEGKTPARPDFAALARQYNMTARHTGLVSEQQLKETDLGKSGVFNTETFRNVEVTGEIFGPTTLYKVVVSYPPVNSTKRYIFWKTRDEAGRVPKWDDPDIKDEARAEWKLREARKLALDAANGLKAEAEKKDNAGKSLKALVAGKKDAKIDIEQPPKFSWLTNPLSGEAPEISEVGDLTKPGKSFMQKVFKMRPGQVEVATNMAESEIYVVRMIELTPFVDLWEDFTSSETVPHYFPLLVETVRREVDPAWRAQVLAEAKFKDNRKELKKSAEGRPAPQSDEPAGAPPPEDM